MLRRDLFVSAAVAGFLATTRGSAKEETKSVFIRNGEVTLATVAHGQPHRGTILLAMGATASMIWWPESLVEALVAGGYQVIRFDNRDTGQSTINPPGDIDYDIADLAGDLIAILDGYEVDSAHVVGMSLGGYVAQLAALEHPTRIKSLTLISSEPLGVAYAGEGIAPEFMDHFRSMSDLDWTDHDAVVAFLLRIAELSSGSAIAFDTYAARDQIERELKRTDSMASAFNHSMIAGNIPNGASAAALALPVLIVHGSEDPVISIAAARKTSEVVRGSELLVLQGRGHEIPEIDVPGIAAAILRLCSSV